MSVNYWTYSIVLKFSRYVTKLPLKLSYSKCLKIYYTQSFQNCTDTALNRSGIYQFHCNTTHCQRLAHLIWGHGRSSVSLCSLNRNTTGTTSLRHYTFNTHSTELANDFEYLLETIVQNPAVLNVITILDRDCRSYYTIQALMLIWVLEP